MVDLHIHSEFSFDSASKLTDIGARAISVGLDEIAVTDHYDINSSSLLYSLQDELDDKRAFDELTSFSKSLDGKLKINIGIELGQAHDDIKKARAIIKKHDYDFVIGSLHNLRGMPDFYFIDFSKMNDEMCHSFFSQYLCEIYEIVDFGDFDTLAHITYPIRYFNNCGRNVDPMEHIDEMKPIFSKLISKNIALEVNTSGYRKGGINAPYPDYRILEQYYKMGGRMITTGSDAHRVEDIGLNFTEVYNNLKQIGFSGVYTFHKREPKLIEFER